MPFNREQLLDRLEKMFWLPNDWDGYGSIPIAKKVHDVAKDMITYIEVDVDMRIFVEVDPEGALFCDITRPNNKICRMELVVLPEGNIEYVELRESDVISQGSFLLSHTTINDILRA